MNLLWVFIGGGLGSVVRYALGLLQQKINFGVFPWATFVSNVIATALLGIVLYWLSPKFSGNDWLKPLLAIGFCGGFSTFSTFSNDTVQLFQTGSYLLAIANVLVSLISGMALIAFFSK